MDQQNFVQHKPQRTQGTKLLADVKKLALSIKKTEQDPMRQCQGGWRTGTGVGDSKQPLGQANSQDACIIMVREQCDNANGATYESASGSCACEIGQTDLDVSATESENCAFFAADTTDENLNGAVEVLNELVESILEAMQTEHASSQAILDTAFEAVETAQDSTTNTHSAEDINNLREDARQAERASAQCASDLESWRATQAADCQSWENLFAASSGTCGEACPCATNSARFFDAFEVWDALITEFGAQIRTSQQACADATSQVAQLEQDCPTLASTSHSAAQTYSNALALHLSTCSNFVTGVESYQAVESETRLSLGQRNREYDILQQVKCYIDAIEGGVSGELVDGQCPATEHEHFSINFQTLPDAPTCLQACAPVSLADLFEPEMLQWHASDSGAIFSSTGSVLSFQPCPRPRCAEQHAITAEIALPCFVSVIGGSFRQNGFGQADDCRGGRARDEWPDSPDTYEYVMFGTPDQVIYGGCQYGRNFGDEETHVSRTELVTPTNIIRFQGAQDHASERFTIDFAGVRINP